MDVIKEEEEEIIVKETQGRGRGAGKKASKIEMGEKKISDFILDSAAHVGQKPALV